MRTGARKQKYRYLDKKEQYGNVDWKKIVPDKRQTWLTEGIHVEFETFIPLGSREAKVARGEAEDVIFKVYSRGVSTGRDAWAYNFDSETLIANMNRTIDTFNEQVFRWGRRENQGADVDNFVVYDDEEISWSRDLKAKLRRSRFAEFAEQKVRKSLYRPFTKSHLFFDRTMDDMNVCIPVHLPHTGNAYRKSGNYC